VNVLILIGTTQALNLVMSVNITQLKMIKMPANANVTKDSYSKAELVYVLTELTSPTVAVKIYPTTRQEIPTIMISGLVMKASTSQAMNAKIVPIFVLPVLQKVTVLHASTTLPSILLQESASVEIHTNLMVHPA
jgi:hypothetical protein